MLFDLASEAPDFCDFRSSAGRFFEETDAETVAEWEAAREDVRAGKTTIEGIRRESSESYRRIEINLKQTFRATDNVLDPQEAVAA